MRACPHCGVSFHDKWAQGEITPPDGAADQVIWRATSCPECKQTIVYLDESFRPTYKDGAGTTVTGDWEREALRQVRPVGTSRPPVHDAVPPPLKTAYEQACAVLPMSAMASAALSRRCLQQILKEQGYNKNNLADQIDDLLNQQDASKSLPTDLHGTVDAVRNFGNFSAHPITDISTTQVIDVEPHEAEWCLEIIEGLFDHYYVKPTIATERKAELDRKLSLAGKPQSR